MELLGDLGSNRSSFWSILEIVTQDSGMVCAKRAIDPEKEGLPHGRGDVVEVEARFGPFGDSVSFSAR
jgi:hypothetical protein